jgi:hypothetical protein
MEKLGIVVLQKKKLLPYITWRIIKIEKARVFVFNFSLN